MKRLVFSDTALKVIACVAMVIDHIPYIGLKAAYANYYLFPDFIFHAIGRFSAPIFFYMLAKGYSRTRNVKRYALRLLVFAVVSYVPFICMLRGSLPNSENFLHLNIIFTMLFGLLILRTLEKSKNLKIPLVVGLLLISCVADYGVSGILFILCFYYLKNHRKQLVVGYSGLVGVSAFSSFLYQFDGRDITHMKSVITADWFLGSVVVSLAYFVPMFLVLANQRYDVEPARSTGFWRWAFYVFYPLHMIVLLFVRVVKIPH